MAMLLLLQVRDVLFYAFAVAFLLFVHSTQRITPEYVAASLLAYAAFLLSVLAADLHHRGRMPYQRRRAGRAPTAPAGKPGRSPRLAPLTNSPRIPAAGDAASHPSTSARPHTNVFYDGGELGKPPPREPFQPTLLPLSGAAEAAVADASESHSRHDCRTMRGPGSIQFTAERSVCACAALKPILLAPARLLQLLLFSTIPQRPKGAGVTWLLSGVHPGLLLRLMLAAGVVMVYFRERMPRHTCLVFAGCWAAAVTVIAGVWWLVTNPAPGEAGGEAGYRGTSSLFDADIQMQELEVQRGRSGVVGTATEEYTDIEIGTGGRDIEHAGVVYPPRPWRGGDHRAGALGESALGEGLRGGLARLYGREDGSHEASYPPLPSTFDDTGRSDLALSEIEFAGPAGEGGGVPPPPPPAEPATVAPAAASPGLRRSVALALAAVLSLAAFTIAVLWVQLVAEELVAVLGLVGAVLRLDHTLIGATLLAWGASPPRLLTGQPPDRTLHRCPCIRLSQYTDSHGNSPPSPPRACALQVTARRTSCQTRHSRAPPASAPP